MRIDEITIGDRVRRDMGDIEGLARSIDEIGLLHPPVVTPDGRLIAGTRRLAALRLLGWIETPVTVVNLDAVVRGEFAENAIRKDFTPSEMVAIAAALEPLERERAKERMLAGKPCENFSQGDKGKTLDHIARAVGVSRPTLEKARAVVEAAEREPGRFGDLQTQMDETGSVDHAYQQLRRITQRAAIATTAMPASIYRVFYADPPWDYAQVIDGYGPAERHYATMPLEEICALGEQIRAMTATDAVLFLWTTSPKLQSAFEVMEAWGFRYTGAMFVWDKVRHNYGHYNSVRHELLLICARGACTPDTAQLFDSVQTIERSNEHSEKPEEFRQIIETLYPYGARIELFARKRVDGWDAWGAEI